MKQCTLFSLSLLLLGGCLSDPARPPVDTGDNADPPPVSCREPFEESWKRYVADTVVIRSLLDLNKHYTVGVESVTGVDSCGQIGRLDLSRMNIDTLDAAICSLAELTQLLLYNNRLTHLPEAIGSLRRLRELKVQNNRLTSVPASLAGLDSLHTLYLHDNLLERLPDMFAPLDSLRVLELSRNQLDSLPPSLLVRQGVAVSIAGNLLCGVDASLRAWLDQSVMDVVDWQGAQRCGWWTLDMETVNQILQMVVHPDSGYRERVVVGGGRVVGLDLGGLAIDALPDTLCSLAGLTRLDLSQNLLSQLPSCLARVRGLGEIVLAANRFGEVPAMLVDLPALSRVDLGNNLLTALPSAILEQKLDWLDVRDNQISSLPPHPQEWLVDSLLVGGNRLCPDSLPPSVSDWLDHHSADTQGWRVEQIGCGGEE